MPKAESHFDQDFNDLLVRESLIDHNNDCKQRQLNADLRFSQQPNAENILDTTYVDQLQFEKNSQGLDESFFEKSKESFEKIPGVTVFTRQPSSSNVAVSMKHIQNFNEDRHTAKKLPTETEVNSP